MGKTRVRNERRCGYRGRTISSHGYVLIRVGVRHHLADVRGYAYEHRLVAERKIGRKLQPGELVHHLDGNKQNNLESNLEVVTGNKGHLYYHRTRTDLRMPGEENPVITCACGCGTEFYKFDYHNRPRRFVSGHNPQLSPMQERFLSALRTGTKNLSEIRHVTQQSLHGARQMASSLARKKVIERVGHGVYTLTGKKRHG